MKIQKPSAIPLASCAAVELVRSRESFRSLREATGEVPRRENLVYLSFGANMGSRVNNIIRALNCLQDFGTVISLSHLYETEAKYSLNQPPYLNGAVKVCRDR